MGQACGKAKGPSKKAIAELARKVEVLSVLHFLEGHRVTIDNHLRTVESKDSNFELEKLRAAVCASYATDQLTPLEDQFKHHRKTKEAKQAKASYDKMMKGIATTPLELEQLHGSVLVMETYKRLITGMSKDLAVLRKRREKMNEDFAEKIEALKGQVEVAERGHWCRQQIQRWEPERDPAFKRKQLAIEGGPPSPPAGLQSPMIRMVDSAYVLPGETPATASDLSNVRTSF